MDWLGENKTLNTKCVSSKKKKVIIMIKSYSKYVNPINNKNPVSTYVLQTNTQMNKQVCKSLKKHHKTLFKSYRLLVNVHADQCYYHVLKKTFPKSGKRCLCQRGIVKVKLAYVLSQQWMSFCWTKWIVSGPSGLLVDEWMDWWVDKVMGWVVDEVVDWLIGGVSGWTGIYVIWWVSERMDE